MAPTDKHRILSMPVRDHGKAWGSLGIIHGLAQILSERLRRCISRTTYSTPVRQARVISGMTPRVAEDSFAVLIPSVMLLQKPHPAVVTEHPLAEDRVECVTWKSTTTPLRAVTPPRAMAPSDSTVVRDMYSTTPGLPRLTLSSMAIYL
jgi:hypothetical protein